MIISRQTVGDLLLLSALWSGCCLFGIFPILNFIYTLQSFHTPKIVDLLPIVLEKQTKN